MSTHATFSHKVRGTMSDNERQQRMIERIHEDERLHENLTDSTAMVLIGWATAQVKEITDDPTQPDEIVDIQVQAVRKAARMAARVADVTSATIVDHAEAFLQQAHSATLSSSTTPMDNPSMIPSTSAQDVQPAHSVKHNVDTTMVKRSQTWWERWTNRFRSRRKD